MGDFTAGLLSYLTGKNQEIESLLTIETGGLAGTYGETG